MRRVQAGPGTNKYEIKKDTGVTAPVSGTSAAQGYRRAGDAAGPNSSHTTYNATQDVGKLQPSSGDAYWVAK